MPLHTIFLYIYLLLKTVPFLTSEFFIFFFQWVDFNTINKNAPDWNRVVGSELYNHNVDPLENANVVGTADEKLLESLSQLLHNHPVGHGQQLTKAYVKQ